MHVGDTLAQLRREAGLSQGEAAAYLTDSGCPCTQKSVSKWERGVNLPNAEQLLLLFQAFLLGKVLFVILRIIDFRFYLFLFRHLLGLFDGIILPYLFHEGGILGIDTIAESLVLGVCLFDKLIVACILVLLNFLLQITSLPLLSLCISVTHA